MPTVYWDWLNLLVRWVHVIAGIMWVGNSFLFVWLDSALHVATKPREGDVAGEIWLVHSGGFYEVVKRRSLRPADLGPPLYVFKWQSYTTWISGFLLLGIVYWAGGGLYLVDRAIAPLTTLQAIAASLGVLVGGWLAYDLIWRSALARTNERAATILSLSLLAGAAYGLTHLFAGRAAYLHFGALLGTIMAGNVFRTIVPGQDAMLAATRAGLPVDTSHGTRAKARSMHNHYLTLPVLFTMLSNHFAMTYGSHLAWLVLLLIVGVGLALKYVMNHRLGGNRAVLPLGIAALAAAIVLTAQPHVGGAWAGAAGAPPVRFAEVRAIIDTRCVTCHSHHPTNPSFPEAPNGVLFDDPQRIREMAPRILERVVITKTMPLGNVTGITEAERAKLGAWISQGAKIDD